MVRIGSLGALGRWAHWVPEGALGHSFLMCRAPVADPDQNGLGRIGSYAKIHKSKRVYLKAERLPHCAPVTH